MTFPQAIARSAIAAVLAFIVVATTGTIWPIALDLVPIVVGGAAAVTFVAARNAS